MVAATLSIDRITAVRHMRWDHNQIACLQTVFFAIADTAGFTFQNGPNGELRMMMALIGLMAAPGAAQLQPCKSLIAPERLWNISGVGHN